MNIKIIPDGFKNYPGPIMAEITELIASLLENCSGVKSPRPVIVKYHSDGPQCINEGDFRAIYLFPDIHLYGQWIYQFAHEYLHNLIDRRPFLYSSSGLAWFEEVLCATASRFALSYCIDVLGCHKMESSRNKLMGRIHEHRDKLYHEVREYSRVHMSLDQDQHLLRQELYKSGSLIPWLPVLQGRCDDYHRYTVIAEVLLPVFQATPCLWQLIAYVGDTTLWKSLESLFAHLESEISSDSLESLHEQYRILLGSYS